MSAPHSNSQLLKIDSIAFGGDGIARSGGKIWFVPFVITGETVEAAVREPKRDFVRADLVRVVETSADRVTPPCPYFGQCGGCRYQHVQYNKQLELKTEQVRESLRRIGGLKDVTVAPAVGSPQEFHYRNRITVHVRQGRVGFYHVEGRSIVDIERCLIASEKVNEALAGFRKRRRVLEGPITLRDFEGKEFRQVNDTVAELLREHVINLLGAGGDHLVDVFCGAGFFAKALRERYKKVSGIEWNGVALELAKRDLQPHELYYEGDAALVLPQLLVEQNGDGNDVIVDPPAQGLSSEIIDALKSRSIRRVIYISCNPATLARDLKYLCASYSIKQITPFDMFPQTAQVEIVVLLEAN